MSLLPAGPALGEPAAPVVAGPATTDGLTLAVWPAPLDTEGALTPAAIAAAFGAEPWLAEPVELLQPIVTGAFTASVHNKPSKAVDGLSTSILEHALCRGVTMF
jgi:hypothetical protein